MLTQDILTDLFSDKKLLNFSTDFQKEVREKYEALERHFEDEYPESFLDLVRPGEDEWMKRARKRLWSNPTKLGLERVVVLLNKIRQADDFRIIWNSIEETETGIANADNFKDYLEKNLPVYGSLENWLFQGFQKMYLSDPNSVCWIGPKIEDIVLGNPINPFPQFIESEKIFDITDEYVIWEIEKENTDKSKHKRFFHGLDSVNFYEIEYIAETNDAKPMVSFIAYPIFTDIPFKTVGSVLYEIEDSKKIFDSILTPALAEWDQALRRSDDDNVNWVKCANPLTYRYSSGSCKTCKGTGKVPFKNTFNTCGTCNGNGEAASTSSPFNEIVVTIPKRTVTDDNSTLGTIPSPPAGIIERPIDVIKAFGEEVDRRIRNGLKSLGLEFLWEVPLSVSGDSKKQDKKEAHTFLYQTAVWYVYFYEWAAKQLYIQKYKGLENALTAERIANNLPKISVPTDFDIYSADEIAMYLERAKKNEFAPEIIQGLEMDLLIKQYGEGSQYVHRAKIRNTLDPLPNRTFEEIALGVESGFIDMQDAILHNKLSFFTNLLLNKDKNWFEKDFEAKLADLQALAKAEADKLKANSLARIDVGI
jgi:hypothetical protein